MNFDLSEDQELFKATVDRFVGSVDVEKRRQMRHNDGGYAMARWRELAALGLLSLAVDEGQGGLGSSLADWVVVAEALGQGAAVDPWLENGFLPTRILSAAHREPDLENLTNGERIAALAFAEPESRYKLAASSTIARQSGDGFILSGTKRMVMGGALADTFLVTASLDGQTVILLVPAACAGVDRRTYRIVDGSLAAEIHFRDVILPDTALLDLTQQVMMEIVSEARLLAAAEVVGLAQRLLDETLTYVKQREQFGTAIGSFQVIQHRLVDCYAMLEQMRSTLWRAALASRSDAGAWQKTVAGAKSFCSEGGQQIAREAVQMHGGMGITDELIIGHAMKRLMLLSTFFGDIETTLAEYAEAA
jgi:alkylation response protein AidB-like acyl-CoA dehydrogenase